MTGWRNKQASKPPLDVRSNLVQTGIGVEVRAGAPKPDIGSVEALKRALLKARSIAYLKSGVESA